MKLQNLIRPILGIVFAILGYSVSSSYLKIPDPNVQIGANAISLILFGAIGVFLVPVVSVWLKQVSSVFAQRVANEVISQLRLPRLTRGPQKNKKEKEDNRYVNPIVVDTSAIIDGRIAD